MSLRYIHEQPCGCTCCEGARLRAYNGPGLYKAIAADRNPTRSGTTTWTLDRFVWGFQIPTGQLVWAERDVGDLEPGGHIHGVVIWLLERDANFSKRSRLCTSKHWLEPA